MVEGRSASLRTQDDGSGLREAAALHDDPRLDDVAARDLPRLAEVMRPRFAPPRHGLALLVVTLALAVACSDGDSGSAEPQVTSTSHSLAVTTTTSAEARALAEVKLAYERSSRAFIDAAAIPDPGFAALAETHTGPMLEQRRKVLQALRNDGRIIRYPPNSLYRVEIDDDTFKLAGDVATFEICGVDDGERVVVRTGEVIASGVASAQARVAMKRVDGTWKLAEREQVAEWEGVAGCAAA